MEKEVRNAVRPPNQHGAQDVFSLGMSWVSLAAFWEVSWLAQLTNDPLRASMN